MTRARRTALPGLFSLVLGLLCVVPTVSSAALDKLDPELQRLISVSGAPGRPEAAASGGSTSALLDVFIQGDVDPDLLTACGAEPGTVLPGLATARIPASSLLTLAGSSRVQFIQNSHPLQYHLDKNAVETGVVQEMWGGVPPGFANPPAPEYTGSGVLVGIIDTGIDLNHQDFRKSTGDTRVRFLWDQTAGGTPPAGYTYGREWTATEINAGSSTEHDYDGHGTHLAGAAAGNGRATGNGKPQYVYTGMAPEADLVVVKLTLVTDTRILDAVSYVFQKATSLGMNAVVCLAVGSQYGPHDGSTLLERGLNTLAGPGRIIVASAGNDGNTKIHAQTEAPAGASNQVSFQIPAYVMAGNESMQLEAWYGNYTSVSLTLIGPTGLRYGPVSYGGLGGGNTTDGNVFISTMSSASGARGFQITLSRSTSPIASGEWKIQVNNGNTFAVDLHAWICYYLLSNAKPYMAIGQTPTISVTSPATADEIIAVGAYTVKKSWQIPSGTTLSYSQAVLNDIANFSSMGPRRDGLTKPEICASGFGVASARASEASISSTYIVEDGVHNMLTGTSVSAAIVAGAVATLLDEFPGLTPDSVRNILRVRAHRDSYTDNPARLGCWGAGKLSLHQPATSAVGDPAGRGPDARNMAMKSPYPNPMQELTDVPLELSVRTSDIRVAVYDVQGRQVRVLHTGSMEAGPHKLTWDGRNEASEAVPSGSYYIVATDRDEKTSRAIIVTR